ncbi:putative transcription factor C2H2 family [Helianthus annuus]|uniref:Transcription factor C2H2 family n=1 Tax=Helianthus annuus TaxID=4232 RepID=A0A9K3I9V2_HELAN|nr:putative transcription factor C2H2 family [Helianthus annuus]KAJ0527665.1 putative transcription factor C2H2 family [Helianthus annuus]KAJ0544074.1 putative transcription factor C2H2 family [Helianthus annuus]
MMSALDNDQGSYRESHEVAFGCEHYKRKCKLVASCCNKLYTCRLCHDDASDHIMDSCRKATSMMMCMKCLIVQPIGPICSTVSCNSLSMARYYCPTCKLFDDEREIYHCPHCDICRVGKGLGIDYFHCMTCNACMSMPVATTHTCVKNRLQGNCPVCQEYMFTSTSRLKSLDPCGHVMHSSCFQAYTCCYYTCPICNKSLRDMQKKKKKNVSNSVISQVYYGMLDTMLAEEEIPEEYLGRTKDIFCIDCEKEGSAPFHWLYHKCPHCESYNTRLI